MAHDVWMDVHICYLLIAKLIQPEGCELPVIVYTMLYSRVLWLWAGGMPLRLAGRPIELKSRSIMNSWWDTYDNEDVARWIKEEWAGSRNKFIVGFRFRKDNLNERRKKNVHFISKSLQSGLHALPWATIPTNYPKSAISFWCHTSCREYSVLNPTRLCVSQFSISQIR